MYVCKIKMILSYDFFSIGISNNPLRTLCLIKTHLIKMQSSKITLRTVR